MIDPTLAAKFVATRGRAAKWETIGDVRKVVLSDIEQRQMMKYGTNVPDTWPSGEVKMQWVFSGTDPDSGEDIAIYAKPGRMENAIFEAFKNAGAAPEDGGILAVQWTGEVPASQPGLAPAKTWSAQYKAPSVPAITANELI